MGSLVVASTKIQLLSHKRFAVDVILSHSRVDRVVTPTIGGGLKVNWKVNETERYFQDGPWTWRRDGRSQESLPA